MRFIKNKEIRINPLQIIKADKDPLVFWAQINLMGAICAFLCLTGRDKKWRRKHGKITKTKRWRVLGPNRIRKIHGALRNYSLISLKELKLGREAKIQTWGRIFLTKGTLNRYKKARIKILIALKWWIPNKTFWKASKTKTLKK